MDQNLPVKNPEQEPNPEITPEPVFEPRTVLAPERVIVPSSVPAQDSMVESKPVLAPEPVKTYTSGIISLVLGLITWVVSLFSGLLDIKLLVRRGDCIFECSPGDILRRESKKTRPYIQIRQSWPFPGLALHHRITRDYCGSYPWSISHCRSVLVIDFCRVNRSIYFKWEEPYAVVRRHRQHQY